MDCWITGVLDYWILLIATLAGAALFFCLFPRVAPTAKLRMAINRGEAQGIASGYLQTLGYGYNNNVEGFGESTLLSVVKNNLTI
jgi:hypothetical protein